MKKRISPLGRRLILMDRAVERVAIRAGEALVGLVMPTVWLTLGAALVYVLWAWRPR